MLRNVGDMFACNAMRHKIGQRLLYPVTYSCSAGGSFEKEESFIIALTSASA